jgi:tetratricopeptide (TPR) repeat protein
MKKIFITSLALVGMTALPVMAEADTAAKAEASKPVAPVICPGYKAGTTQLPSQRTGRKIGSALEAYNQDLIAESLEILIDIDPSDGFDKAYVNRFIGNIMATQEGQGDKALDYLNKSVSPKELNDREHADTLRLIGDLSMQQQKYQNALQHYQKWMDFTCKEDDKIYTRMAQAYYELKDLPAMVAPASRAIEIQEKKDKNPYVLKMTSFYERKMYPQTVAVAEDLVRVFPEEKRWWSQLGFFYMLVEDYPKALSTFEMAYL